MPDPKVIKKQSVQWQRVPGAEGGTTDVAECVGAALSEKLGAGLVKMENVRLKRKLGYDEVLYIISGRMQVESESGGAQIAEEGDVVFLPKGAVPTYVWEEPCSMFYAIHPSNWQDLMEEPER